jgi:hypothetical protein
MFTQATQVLKSGKKVNRVGETAVVFATREVNPVDCLPSGSNFIFSMRIKHGVAWRDMM